MASSYRTWPYDRLVEELLDKPIVAEVAGKSGRRQKRWCPWTFHPLRHVFATWALSHPRLRLRDVSRLLGHSSTRVARRLRQGVLVRRIRYCATLPYGHLSLTHG